MMRVEVWSDIMCPFCFIGKKNLEDAIHQAGLQGKIEVEWKSYQLDPEIQSGKYENSVTYLSEAKGMPIERVREMMSSVAQTARNAGLQINLEKSIPANTLDAHRSLHIAKSVSLETADRLKALLFEAHFVKGLDVADKAILKDLAQKSGVDNAKFESEFQSTQVDYEINQDIQEARNIGVRGVPFFVIDRKYAISGAQPVDVFAETIDKAYSEWSNS